MSAILKSTWLLIPVLLLLHQDYWLWDNQELIWGFIPAGLFSHLCVSLLASVAWFLICWFHWPDFSESPSLNSSETTAAQSESTTAEAR